MGKEEDEFYFDKIEEIREKVYEFYNLSKRTDLIMVYEMQGNKIYSYIYKNHVNSLNPQSRVILKKQYEEARALEKIVLFVKDDLRKKFKSFTI